MKKAILYLGVVAALYACAPSVVIYETQSDRHVRIFTNGNGISYKRDTVKFVSARGTKYTISNDGKYAFIFE